MSLDLASTTAQIDGMAQALRDRQSDRQERIGRALEAVRDFDVDGYRLRRQQSGEAEFLPGVVDAPGSRFAPPSAPADFCVAAVDGSHIDVDRHLPARCFLINIGVSVLTYGAHARADLHNEPTLYARDEEMTIRDPATYREQQIEGAVLGAKRTVEEIRAMDRTVRGLPDDTPTLAVMDGPLAMLGLVGARNQDFVLRELVEEGFAEALDRLGELARSRPLAVAGYISLPGSSEVVRALRLMVCSYGGLDAGYRCGIRGPGRQPCDGCVGGLLDRDVFARLLGPGERSALFSTSYPATARYYDADILFFYVDVGHEIARVEVPGWVAEDEARLALVHALVVDQCDRGRGYPVALMEAHEQAVVGGADRRFFVQAVESALSSQRLPVYSSEKARSKRIRMM
jgi:GNAT superfamily N-acetyltransferase